MEEKDFEKIVIARHVLQHIWDIHCKRAKEWDDLSMALSVALDILYGRQRKRSSYEALRSISSIQKIITVLNFVKFDSLSSGDEESVQRIGNHIECLECAVGMISHYKKKLEDEWG